MLFLYLTLDLLVNKQKVAVFSFFFVDSVCYVTLLQDEFSVNVHVFKGATINLQRRKNL